ncbi:Tfp pilus assembly protein pilus retraction ATPase PilT-like protein [Thermocrinis albus DSM 14484]|uniref:Tfp pilus assembly protein pilus retraction ATPase PilT-like protein n=1 Tax=Thermocrinis albus (strain DSM 14484 / JCM 11386 / HI 11/12) TaxID=638303 RepID=D3SP94_THEAH|nr:Tfp pilus assembly protein PilT [Thermocrinis albus]ADC88981.1 Tfp pilus assembly protein pilus retraction ATPase PilT-like protein [Thermocrinis albus DSM 14484]
MNYAPEILSYMSSSKDITEVLLVPKAPPTERREGKLIKFMDVVLSADDVRDTLVALRTHAPTLMGPLGREGSFSFGMHGVGRFRVSYITQRGSYVVSIIKTPMEIPRLYTLCEDEGIIPRLEELLRLSHQRLYVIKGRDPIRTSTFVYSLLQHIVNTMSKVIFVLEKNLTFLLKHGSSLVVQREVGLDVESFEEGLLDAMRINPDILYINFQDVMSQRELDLLVRLSHMGTVVLLQAPVAEEHLLHSTGVVQIEVRPSGVSGKLKVQIMETLPEEPENR